MNYMALLLLLYTDYINTTQISDIKKKIICVNVVMLCLCVHINELS